MRDPDRDVDVFFQQIDDAVDEQRARGNTRVAFEKLEQDRRHIHAPEQDRRRYRELPARLERATGGCGFGLFDFAENALAVREKARPCFGEADRARRSMQQARADSRFEPRNGPRERRRRQHETPRRGCEASRIGHRNERAHALKTIHFTIPPAAMLPCQARLFSALPDCGEDSPSNREATMQTTQQTAASERYGKCIEVSKRIRWDIDRDVIRGRTFDVSKKFLPKGLSKIEQLPFLSAQERRMLSQIQGRTYANIFGLVERYIGAKILEISREHWLGDQTALEALVRFTDEELKHQELFRRIEAMIAEDMPAGYAFVPNPNEVAKAVLSKCTWAVLGLTCHIELFTQEHYRQSIDPDGELSELYKDVFLYHWKEESQHAILDELEWQREDARLSEPQREQAVTDLIELVGAVDGILQMQSAADVDYFLRVCGRTFDGKQVQQIRDTILKAYRWQYITSGVQDERFQKILGGMITGAQMQRIGAALKPIVSDS